MKPFFTILLALVSMGLFSGCTSSSQTVYDPWEPMNRKVFAMNKQLDRFIAKPVATGYQTVLPQPVRKGVSNFFNNIGEINTIANDLLQAKFSQAGQDTLRFLMNSVFGFFGIFDVAKQEGLERHTEDFGQTLAVWGLKKSPYIVVPFLGPSTVVDSVASVTTSQARPLSPVYYADHIPTRNQIIALMAIDKRAGLLDAEKLLDDSTDEYVFQRAAYTQYRQNQIRDGKIEEDDGFEFEDDVSQNLLGSRPHQYLVINDSPSTFPPFYIYRNFFPQSYGTSVSQP